MSTTTVSTPERTTASKVVPKRATYLPAFDIWKTEDRLILQGDVPGVEPEDLDIRFEDGTLKLAAKVSPRLPSAGVLRSEYGVGNYERHFAVGDEIDAERISAELSNGVITIELPIAEKAKPRKIEIRTR